MIQCSVLGDDCRKVYEWEQSGAAEESAARAAGWARLDYESGIKYVCPTCRKPRPREPRQSGPDQDQLDLTCELT